MKTFYYFLFSFYSIGYIKELFGNFWVLRFGKRAKIYYKRRLISSNFIKYEIINEWGNKSLAIKDYFGIKIFNKYGCELKNNCYNFVKDQSCPIECNCIFKKVLGIT